MRVIMFQRQFEDKILAGIKKSTIRGKARCKPGDELSLRVWEDKPYRSKQRAIGSSRICSKVSKVRVESFGGYLVYCIDGHELDAAGVIALASREGFDTLTEMGKWFITNKKLGDRQVFYGEMIEWQ